MSKNKKFKVEAEIVNGKCPTCDQFTMLVGIEQSFFRCMNCGSDMEQHINGKITYPWSCTNPPTSCTARYPRATILVGLLAILF